MEKSLCRAKPNINTRKIGATYRKGYLNQFYQITEMESGFVISLIVFEWFPLHVMTRLSLPHVIV